MDLFHCITPKKMEQSGLLERAKSEERSKSEEKDPIVPPRGTRRTSLPAKAQPIKKTSNGYLSNTLGKERPRNGTWSFHYADKKKSDDSLEKLTSRTLSPPPETLQRKYSRASSTSSTTSGRLPRHPELPPLNLNHNDGPKLKDYLEKPRLVSTMGRKISKQEDLSVDQLVPGLAQLSMYYNQTLLSSEDDYDSRFTTSPLNTFHTNTNRCM